MAVSFVAILIVACGMALLAKRLRLPYTVVLVVAGLIVSALSAAGQLGLNLKLTPEERIRKLMELQRFAEKLNRAGQFDEHPSSTKSELKKRDLSPKSFSGTIL